MLALGGGFSLRRFVTLFSDSTALKQYLCILIFHTDITNIAGHILRTLRLILWTAITITLVALAY